MRNSSLSLKALRTLEIELLQNVLTSWPSSSPFSLTPLAFKDLDLSAFSPFRAGEPCQELHSSAEGISTLGCSKVQPRQKEACLSFACSLFSIGLTVVAVVEVLY